jgi:hypothetical protein
VSRAKGMARSKRPRLGKSIYCVRGRRSGRALTDLPAGILGKSSDLHAVRGAARPGRSAAILGVSAAFTVASAARELDREALSHEIGTILCMPLARDSGGDVSGRPGIPEWIGPQRTESCGKSCAVSKRSSPSRSSRRRTDGELTWDNVPGIHGILIFNKAEAIHEFDLGDLAGAMGRKVSLNIGFCGCGGCQHRRVNHRRRRERGREIAGPWKATHHAGASCPGRGGSTRPQSSCFSDGAIKVWMVG